MTEYAEEIQEQRTPSFWLIAGVLAALLIIIWLIARNEGRPLKPIRPTIIPGQIDLVGQPVIVTFEQLNADPHAFHGQRIRVTGGYSPQPEPDCHDYSGPAIHWALISGGLQLNALGFKRVLQLIPAGALLTVDGVWTLYDGPLGCGKGPAPGQVWYLQVERIVQPNPLPGLEARPPGMGDAPELGATPSGTDAPSITPTGEGETAVPTPTDQPSPTPGLGPTGSPSPSPTATLAAGATPTPSPTGSPDGRPTLTPTGSSSSTATNTAVPTPTNNATTIPSPTPPVETTATRGPSPTPGGYPGPSTPGTPTATPDPY